MITDVIVGFDDIDAYYLANTFSASQLRCEKRQAEIEIAVESHFDTATPFPWRDFADCCREAISWQHGHRPKIKAHQGHIDVSAIKSRCDIVTTIEQYTKLRKSGRNFTGCCPIHEDKHPSMTVYPDNQTFHCYGCNRGGDVFSFIQAVENTDFRGAAAILGGR